MATLYTMDTLAPMTDVDTSAASPKTISDAAFVVENGEFEWVGPEAELPDDLRQNCEDIIPLGAGIVTPGLIDSHTHLVYGGDRSHEFMQQLAGVTYPDILAAGGGIMATMRATREESEDELFDSARKRLINLGQSGVTTVEIKSGYGLSLEHELKMLRVVAELRAERPETIVPTLLGPHAAPPEFKDDREGYMDLLVKELLPRVAEEQLAEAVDIFCEPFAFSTEDAKRWYLAALEHGLKIKGHMEQFNAMGGTELAASLGALSCDHLEAATELGVKAMACHGTTAVLLPGAYYYLGMTEPPPLGLLRQKGVPIAIATDCNPGSSPCQSLLLAMNLAAVLWKMTITEVWLGVTRNGARALGFEDRGMIEPGLKADFCHFDSPSLAELVHVQGGNPLIERYIDGIDGHY